MTIGSGPNISHPTASRIRFHYPPKLQFRFRSLFLRTVNPAVPLITSNGVAHTFSKPSNPHSVSVRPVQLVQTSVKFSIPAVSIPEVAILRPAAPCPSPIRPLGPAPPSLPPSPQPPCLLPVSPITGSRPSRRHTPPTVFPLFFSFLLLPEIFFRHLTGDPVRTTLLCAPNT